MRLRMRPTAIGLLIVPLVLAAAMPSAHAIHFYRGPSGGCTPADGALGIAPDPSATVHTVEVGHNTFLDTDTGFAISAIDGEAVTTVKAGDAVRWTWNSSHCHSVETTDAPAAFTSGFHYPTTPPESPAVAPGAFDYPILDDTPTLSFTFTFTTPGTYLYKCVHHASIGMVGTIVVEP